MEDRIFVDNKSFVVKTDTQKGTLSSTIYTEQRDQLHMLHTFTEQHQETYSKDDIMNFHKKALLFLFKKLQKNEDLEQEEKGTSDKKETENTPSQDTLQPRFNTFCETHSPEHMQAVFLLKENALYHFMIATETKEYEKNISNLIDFVHDNQSLKNIINEWKTLIQVYDEYQIFCEKITDTDILVCVMNKNVQVGSMIKISEKFRKNLVQSLYTQ